MTDEKKSKNDEKLRKALVVALALTLVGVLAAFVYFSWEVSAPLPPASQEEERADWLPLLSGQSFKIDSRSANVTLDVFLFEKISTLDFKSYMDGSGQIEAVFTTKGGSETNAPVYESGDSLVLDIGGQQLPLWLELGEYPILILQGSERLIFTPVNQNLFKSAKPN